MSKRPQSKTLGVSYDSSRGQFRAMLDGRHLGYFKTSAQAIAEIEKIKNRVERVKKMFDDAFEADRKERESNPTQYFFDHDGDKPQEWLEAERRDLDQSLNGETIP